MPLRPEHVHAVTRNTERALGPWKGAAALPDGRERLVVVRLLRDLRHQLAVDDLVVLVEDHHGAGGDPGERAIPEEHAVVLGELLPAHERERHHVLWPFGRAEALRG